MTEPPQPIRPPQPGNPYAGTPRPLGTWGTPPPLYGATPSLREHPQSGTVLVVGLISLFAIVTGPFAWAMGSKARAEVASGRYAPSTALTLGWALGIVTTVLLLMAVLGIGVALAGFLALRA